jgi:hypothetical protein
MREVTLKVGCDGVLSNPLEESVAQRRDKDKSRMLIANLAAKCCPNIEKAPATLAEGFR